MFASYWPVCVCVCVIQMFCLVNTMAIPLINIKPMVLLKKYNNYNEHTYKTYIRKRARVF